MGSKLLVASLFVEELFMFEWRFSDETVSSVPK